LELLDRNSYADLLNCARITCDDWSALADVVVRQPNILFGREARLRKALLSLAIIGLAGCTTTEQAATVLHSKWDGQPADNFFLQFGPPASAYTMTDGGKIFSWVGGRANIPLSGSASTTTNVIGSTAISTTTYQGGGTLALGCSVQIVTTKSGVITAIKPTGDSLGMWQTSRCAEIFGAG
jgi:hypothetical protein